ncbi:hypothetical protein AVEN_185203-1 [Araneus ventricosus]|uniref:Uncharacterized protein n=1 Tax=Araneus ventricosus TaxID=182803 RepID=A0A4Y2M9C1_ARAVE|nr:hypothetical protein AVEN_185203-1 [Araneus ventricosus]
MSSKWRWSFLRTLRGENVLDDSRCSNTIDFISTQRPELVSFYCSEGIFHLHSANYEDSFAFEPNLCFLMRIPSNLEALLFKCSLAEKEYNCTAKEFEECLEALNAITQTEDLALAATREELNLVCRKLQHGVRCIDDHSYRCFTAGQRRIFNSVVSESRHVINDLCVPGKLQEGLYDIAHK